ncbi:MAG: SDR family oxidoreductase [Alphaproteobacteria bacterium]
MNIAVFGATSGLGRDLIAALSDEGFKIIAIGRDQQRLRATIASPATFKVADLRDPASLSVALDGADMVVSVAHARFTEAILAAAPDRCRRIVLLGSTRRFTRLPDRSADAVRAAEAALAASGRSGVMLHPTMIYGRPGDRTIRRIIEYFQRWPRWLPVPVPLPAGGRTLVQPIFASDVVQAIRMALVRSEAPGSAIVVAGPVATTSADLVRACARATGRTALLLPAPLGLLRAAVQLATRFGIVATLSAREVERLVEDKHFDVEAMRRRLGVDPVPLSVGLDQRNYRTSDLDTALATPPRIERRVR